MRLPLEEELPQRVSWLEHLRWIFIAGILLIATFARFALNLGFDFSGLAVVLVIMTLYNGVFHIFSRRKYDSRLIVNTNIALDWISLTLILYFTGGVENPFYFYYLFHLIIAGLLLSKRDVYLQAANASLLFAALVFLELSGIIPHQPVAGYLDTALFGSPVYALSKVVILGMALFLTAWLTNTIMSHLRKSEQRVVVLAETLRERNEELGQLYREYRDLAEQRAFYARKISHELKSPLASLQTVLHTVHGGYAGPLNEKQSELVASAEHRAEQLTNMLTDLLSLSRLSQTLPDMREIDIGKNIREILDDYRERAEAKGLAVEYHLEPVQIQMDPSDLREIIVNLLSNAVKYTNSGRVGLSIGEHLEQALITVQDTGIGLTEEDRTHLFQEFYRNPSAVALDKRGTGLGLAVVKRAVERYGGLISVESTPGKGTIFTVKLPLRNRL